MKKGFAKASLLPSLLVFATIGKHSFAQGLDTLLKQLDDYTKYAAQEAEKIRR